MTTRPTALADAKRLIDAAIGTGDLRKIRYWTDVWFQIQELKLTRA